jgi:hypothetical protein
MLPRYHEIIAHPMDLSTMRDKIQKHKYATADQMLKDFLLMKNNALKFVSASEAKLPSCCDTNQLKRR